MKNILEILRELEKTPEQATIDIFEMDCIKGLNDKDHNEFAEKLDTLVKSFEIRDIDVQKTPHRIASLLSGEKIISFSETIFKYLREGSRRKKLMECGVLFPNRFKKN